MRETAGREEAGRRAETGEGTGAATAGPAAEAGGERRTPLYAEHVAAGARLTTFAGWVLPLFFGGILREHRAVRERAGLFDVSHMGRLEVRGRGAAATLEWVLTADVGGLPAGRGRYTLMCSPAGGVLDDLIVYRLGEERFLLVVNAANTEDDRRWLEEHALPGTEVEDRTGGTALLALQGPRAAAIMSRASGAGAPWQALSRFAVAEGELAEVPALVARTGYTGEDGFEIMVAAPAAPAVWRGLLEAGREEGLEPAGLGARDTLRLEAGLPLYGHELGEDVSPLEARLERFVCWSKDFVGREALAAERERGPVRRLVGLRLERVEAAGVPRRGYAVLEGGEPVGTVTSGGPAPTLGGAVALALVRSGAGRSGFLEVMVRGKAVRAAVVEPPFYRRRDGAGRRG